MKKIILMVLFVTMLSHAGFTRANDVVTDDVTKLQWDDKDYENDTNEPPSKLATSLQDAIDFCENLDLDSHGDWKLPNVNELKTIIDIEQDSTKIYSTFVNKASFYYWTSTTNIEDTTQVFLVGFSNGSINSAGKLSDDYNVRCVRVDDSD